MAVDGYFLVVYLRELLKTKSLTKNSCNRQTKLVSKRIASCNIKLFHKTDEITLVQTFSLFSAKFIIGITGTFIKPVAKSTLFAQRTAFYAIQIRSKDKTDFSFMNRFFLKKKMHDIKKHKKIGMECGWKIVLVVISRETRSRRKEYKERGKK